MMTSYPSIFKLDLLDFQKNMTALKKTATKDDVAEIRQDMAEMIQGSTHEVSNDDALLKYLIPCFVESKRNEVLNNDVTSRCSTLQKCRSI